MTPYNVDIANQDAPNPLYPAAGCSQYFSFRQLLHEDTLDPTGQPPFANPCNASQRIPSSIPQFLHTRPVLDWNHGSANHTYADLRSLGRRADSQRGRSRLAGIRNTVPRKLRYRRHLVHGHQLSGGLSKPDIILPTGVRALIKTLTFDANNKPVALGEFCD